MVFSLLMVIRTDYKQSIIVMMTNPIESYWRLGSPYIRVIRIHAAITLSLTEAITSPIQEATTSPMQEAVSLMVIIHRY